MSTPMPTAVRKASKAADEAYKQAYMANFEEKKPTEKADSGDEAPKSESNVDQEAQSVDNQQVTQETSTKEPQPEIKSQETAPDATVWEQRYKTLQGMWKKDVPELQSENATLKARLAEMETKLHEASQQTEQPQEAKRYLTDDDIEEFGDDMIGIVRRAAKEEFAPELARIEAENQRLKQQLDGVGSSVVQTERQRVLSVLDGQLPNWREINQSSEFMEWLQQVDPYSGQKKHNLLLSAFENNDIDRTLAFFKGFQTETAAVNTEGQATTQRTPQVDVDKLVAPGTPKASGGSARTQEKSSRIWTEQEIGSFYNAVAAGKYRSEAKVKEKNRIEREIEKAVQEQRVRVTGYQPPSN